MQPRPMAPVNWAYFTASWCLWQFQVRLRWASLHSLLPGIIFFNAFILISSRSKYTLPMLIQTLRDDVYRAEYGAIYLGLAITVIPIIITYALFSRYIVSGIAIGSMKE
jgi:ABC-type maltose transport system permease subunit